MEQDQDAGSPLTGRRVRADTRHPVYRGGKWVSEIREPRKSNRIWLGTYPTPEMALRGADAALNFPRAAASCSPDDIRAAAASSMSGSGAAGTAGASTPEHKAGDKRIVDEDDVFQVPRLLESMAEGLMMSPPRLSPTNDGAVSREDDDDGMSLWGH